MKGLSNNKGSGDRVKEMRMRWREGKGRYSPGQSYIYIYIYQESRTVSLLESEAYERPETKECIKKFPRFPAETLIMMKFCEAAINEHKFCKYIGE